MTRRFALFTLAALFAAGVVHAAEDPGTVFMWKVHRGETSVYLLGSIHALKAEAYPLPEIIVSAFDEAQVVVFEVDLDEMNGAALQMLAAGSLEAGQTLEQVLGPALWIEVGAAAADAGLDPSMLQFMKPWMAALSVAAVELTAAGYLPSYGLDSHFSELAKEEGKERVALETVEYQIGLFADFTPDESTEFLRYTLSDLKSIGPVLDALYRHWLVGEVEPVEALLGSEFQEFPDLYSTLITDRNLRWMDRIEELLAGERDAMVVVGALHLVGEQGLVALLRQKGYVVDQM
jgi:uncharacterized protein YbaP (TraB family)